MIVTAYKQLRAEDAVPGSSSAYRITVRQLEALVRISEALARLRARDVVAVEDVVEVHILHCIQSQGWWSGVQGHSTRMSGLGFKLWGSAVA